MSYYVFFSTEIELGKCGNTKFRIDRDISGFIEEDAPYTGESADDLCVSTGLSFWRRMKMFFPCKSIAPPPSNGLSTNFIHIIDFSLHLARIN